MLVYQSVYNQPKSHGSTQKSFQKPETFTLGARNVASQVHRQQM